MIPEYITIEIKPFVVEEKDLTPAELFGMSRCPVEVLFNTPIYELLLLQFFEYDHLPEHLQNVSKPFYDMAHHIAESLPDNAEKTVALRKLLEAKDCAVRAFICK